MNEWPIPPISSPLGLIDCVLLVFAILRVTHKRIQELRDPTLGSFFAAIFSAAVSVSAVAIAVSAFLMVLAYVGLMAFGHPKSVGLAFLLLLIGQQVCAFAGVISAYFAGPSFSRFIWQGPPDKSKTDQG